MGFKNSKKSKSSKSTKNSIADVFIKLEDTGNGIGIGTHDVTISNIHYKGITELRGKYDPPGTKAPVAEFVFENEDGDTISKDIVLRDRKFTVFKRLSRAAFDEDRRKKLAAKGGIKLEKFLGQKLTITVTEDEFEGEKITKYAKFVEGDMVDESEDDDTYEEAEDDEETYEDYEEEDDYEDE